MSKLKKAIISPHLFIRDFLNKRFPIKYSELKYSLERIYTTREAFAEVEELDCKIGNITDIDVVFTWVDNSDPSWMVKFNKYSKENSEKLSIGATNPARYESHEELYYSVKSVLEKLPWVRTIYIVTDEQVPKWLPDLSETSKKKIKIVDHKDIIKKDYLPTFNSHVIEANIFKISGLSENFIYFNDDVFVGRRHPKSHFFKSNGLASIFISNKTYSVISSKRQTATTLATKNSTNLLKRQYGITPDLSIQHTYIPLKKEFFQLAEKIFEKEIKNFQRNKFRSKDDINVGTALVPWMMYLEGKAQFSRDICFYFNCRSNDGKAQMKFLLNQKENGFTPDSICANDFIKEREDDLFYFKEFLEQYF